MSRFGKATKKPIPIDWYKHSHNDTEPLNNWVESFGDNPKDHFFFAGSDMSLRVRTLEGTSYEVPDGYIIIRGTRGEYYPCDSKIFEETYNVI